MKKFFIIAFLFFFNYALADNEFVFESSTIEYKDDENLIIASGNVKVTSSDGIDIFANESKYFKLQNKLLLTGDVKVVDKNKDIVILSNLIQYDRNINLIESKNKTLVEINNYSITTSNLKYFRSKEILKSNNITTLTDKFQNKVVADNFTYSIDKKKI